MGEQNENNITNEKKKVYINCDGYYPQCPTCQHFDLDMIKDIEKCSNCGQFLDWEDLI